MHNDTNAVGGRITELLGPARGTRRAGYPRTFPVRAATASEMRYTFVWPIRSAREVEWDVSAGGGGISEYGTESS